MTILVLNAGSSSLKWKLYSLKTETLLASGLIEGIGETKGKVHLETKGHKSMKELPLKEHRTAFTHLFESFRSHQIIDLEHDLDGIGHRVVHGGERFTRPTHIDGHNIEALRALNTLAPLHNPSNLLGIETTMALAPHIPNIAIFDTAFHSTLPPQAYRYALPASLYEDDKIRRYGFHGTSHHYVALQAAILSQRPLHTLNLITLHLGNGASACAIKEGQSVDTSMGFTPLEGLVMGTRSGDIDPAIIPYIMQKHQLSAEEVQQLLNRESGLKGLCGDNDLRHIIGRAQEGDSDAQMALEIFCYRIKKYIGSYIAILGRLDAIVFTGGIGEHAPSVRQMILHGLDDAFGIVLDEEKNHRAKEQLIHTPSSRCRLLVIETNEELQIALESAEHLARS